MNVSSIPSFTTHIPSGPLPIALAIGAYRVSGSLTNTETTHGIRERTFEGEMPICVAHPDPRLSRDLHRAGLPSGARLGRQSRRSLSRPTTTVSIVFTEPRRSTPTPSRNRRQQPSASPGWDSDGVRGAVAQRVPFARVNFSTTFLQTGTQRRDWPRSVTFNGSISLEPGTSASRGSRTGRMSSP